MNSVGFSYRKNLVQSVVLTNAIFIIFHLVISIILFNKMGFIGVACLMFNDLLLGHFLAIYLELKIFSLVIFGLLNFVLTLAFSLMILFAILLLFPLQSWYSDYLLKSDLQEEVVLMNLIGQNKTLPIIVLLTLFLLYILKLILAIRVNQSYKEGASTEDRTALLEMV